MGAVGVGTSVGHREQVGLGVLDLEVLVSELFSVDGLATGAVVLGEISSLSMNWFMMRWNPHPLYPNPFSPVQRALKFSAVLGTMSL